MRLFWIAFSIVTAAYVIYYAVMILIDMRHQSTQKKSKAETISVADMQTARPKKVSETENHKSFSEVKKVVEDIVASAPPASPEDTGTDENVPSSPGGQDLSLVDAYFRSLPVQPLAHFGGLYGSTMKEQIYYAKNRATTHIVLDGIK